MGRVKLAIKKLEHTNNRQITYSKRRCGILKKARELSILCDIDIFLIMFSPTGKPTICLGERSNMEDVIARFSELTPQERSKRKLESLEALKKTFKKLNHDVNIEDFLGVSSHTMEELQNELRRLQSQLSDVQEKLWYYGNETEQITSIDQARDVEETIQESLTRLHIHKETLKNNQLMALAQAGQQLYHNSICLPPAIEGTHQQQPISAWLSNHEGQQVLVQEDPNFVLPHRDVNCVADTSLSMPSGYNVLNCRQADMEVGSSSQPETFSNEFNTCGLRLQLGGQSSSYLQHHQYPQNSVTEGKKFKSDMDTSLHATASVDYGTPSIEPISAGYDGLAHQWPSSSNHHAVMSLFDKYSFPQQESLAMIEPASTSICHQIDSSGQLEHSPQSQTHITSECHMGISGLVSLL